MCAHPPLCSTCWYTSSSRVKAEDAACCKGEPIDKVCETADATASFKSDVWKHLGFSVSRTEEKRRKRWWADQKTLRRNWRTRTNTQLRHLFAQVVTFKDQLLFNKCQFPSLYMLFFFKKPNKYHATYCFDICTSLQTTWVLRSRLFILYSSIYESLS